MEEQGFVVPENEFKKYSQIAVQYKNNVATSNDRLKLFYGEETRPYISSPSDKEIIWARTKLQDQDNRDCAIAKRMLAENAELEELALQTKENNAELEKLFALEAAMFEWAWQTSVNAKDNDRKIKKEEWFFAVTIFDYLKNSLENRSLDMRLASGAEFASSLLAYAKRLNVRPLSGVEERLKELNDAQQDIIRTRKLLGSAKDATVRFSYDFMDTKSRVFHSRTKSAGWAKKNLQSDSNGHFTRKKLVLLYALYMGINDIESRLSMEFESKLIHALGCTDLIEAHQNHNRRARRLSFKRKEIDPIAQKLGKALQGVLSTPAKKDRCVDEYIPDENITKKSLKLLVGLGKCVSKLETSYSYKKYGTQIENTLDVMSRAYDFMYKVKGSLKGVGDFTEEQGFPLPKSAIKLLQDKDPRYLPPERRPVEAQFRGR